MLKVIDQDGDMSDCVSGLVLRKTDSGLYNRIAMFRFVGTSGQRVRDRTYMQKGQKEDYETVRQWFDKCEPQVLTIA